MRRGWCRSCWINWRSCPKSAFHCRCRVIRVLLGLCNELIEEPGRLITLHDWAARLGTSEKTLMRMFQRETGLSFRGWRQRARLLSSLSALEEGASVTHTALACGYDSTSAFIAAFKGLFGHTPGDLFK
ncbi:AraC family transcriptional regulator [Pseudomonas cerasi]|nr:AraC family transcriptional regulator [Pseudomonas cerasi]